MIDSGILFAVAVYFLVVPLVALIVALIARSRADRLARKVELLEGDVERMRRFVLEPRAAVEGVPEPAKAARAEAAAAPAALATPSPVAAPRPAPAAAPSSPWRDAATAAGREASRAASGGAEAPRAAEPFAGLAQETARKKGERRNLEETLASRLPVWIGSAALFLAAAFLLKFTFDRGLLGPTARVVIGVLFGLALLVLGQRLAARSARVAQGLTAAGIASLYASFLAGTSLYHLVPRPAGFGLMVLTTAVAVLLSLRQGPFIAVLGLVGGFLTPALIGSTEHNPVGLFGYLTLLEIGLLLAARRRALWPLAALTGLGGGAWAALWLALRFEPGDAAPVGLFLLASAALFVVAGRRLASEKEAPWGGAGFANGLTLGVVGGAVALSACLVGAGDFGTIEWLFLGLLAAGSIVLARFAAPHEPLPWIAWAAGLLLLARWASVAPDGAALPSSFGWTALLYGGLLAVGGYAALWGAASPVRFAALSAASAFGYFLCAWACLRTAPPAGGWGVWSLGLATVFVAAALPVARRRALGANLEAPLAALAAAATLFLSAAAPFELDRFTLTVAWAIEAPLLILVERRTGVKGLRWLAAALGAAALARLVLNPYLYEYPLGDTPVFNWLLYGIGAPVAAFALAGRLLGPLENPSGERIPNNAPPRIHELFELAAIGTGMLLIALETRHYFHAAPIEGGYRLADAGPFYVAEAGTILALWALLGWGLDAWGGRVARRSLELGGRAALGVSLGVGLFVVGLVVNPLFAPRPVGATPVFNGLLAAYGAPALIAALLARRAARIGWPTWAARLCAAGALVYAFLFLTLEVRQFFHGDVLYGGATTSAEMYSYSAAYVLFGTLLLGAAIATRGLVLRWGSLAVMLLAVGKVFLVDLSELKDLYRVFSLFGLGASLLLLAYLYQRFVFGRRNER